MTWPNPTKSPVQILNCWTQLAHSILIGFKEALSLQNTEILTLFNLLRVIIRICINISFLILLLYFVLENCVFYVTMKKILSEKETQALLFILEFQQKENKCVYIHLFGSYGIYCFICVMCCIPRNSVMFILLLCVHLFYWIWCSIYCVKCIICDVT